MEEEAVDEGLLPAEIPRSLDLPVEDAGLPPLAKELVRGGGGGFGPFLMLRENIFNIVS